MFRYLHWNGRKCEEDFGGELMTRSKSKLKTFAFRKVPADGTDKSQIYLEGGKKCFPAAECLMQVMGNFETTENLT